MFEKKIFKENLKINNFKAELKIFKFWDEIFENFFLVFFSHSTFQKKISDFFPFQKIFKSFQPDFIFIFLTHFSLRWHERNPRRNY